jgi:hypothetical protein
MADITMCRGDDCPSKERCYRFMAIPNSHWQAFFSETPVMLPGKDRCGHFWPVKEEENDN